MKARALAIILFALSWSPLLAQTLFITVRPYLHHLPTSMAVQTEGYGDATAMDDGIRRILTAVVRSFPLPIVEGERTVVVSFGQPISQLGSGITGSDIDLGTDIDAPLGTPARAAGDGTVAETSYDDDLGNYVVINHMNSLKTIYGHLGGFAGKQKGRPVRAGDVIGYVGMTGLVTGPMLHFAILYAEKYVNPTLALDRFAQLN